MKGELTLKILEKIKEGVGAASDVLAVFLTAGYGVSSGKIDYLLRKRQGQRERDRVRAEEAREIKKRCYDFFKSLKRDGLLRGTMADPELTSKGYFKIKELKLRQKERLPEPAYPKSEANRVIIVIFDIPEEMRRKRAWLRATLKNLEFEKIQQSVWKGTNKIPRELLRDLERFNLMSYVDIFEATKLGTLKF